MSSLRAGALRHVLLIASLWVFSIPAQAIEFTRYHTTNEINDYLRTTARKHSDFVTFRRLGYSDQGREVNFVILSKANVASAPAIFINGTHHGNEKSGTEAVLGLIDYLTANDDRPEITELLENYAIYILPLANPDGHASNSRFSVDGTDPNRDYSHPHRDASQSFKVRSIRLIKQLADRVRFRAAAAYHSGLEAVLWPWCYTNQRNPEQDTFYTLAKIAAKAMGVSRYVQSNSDYPSAGEFIDYVYDSHGTLALTFEVSADSAPPSTELPGVVKRAVAGGLAFMLSIQDLDQGNLALQRAPNSANLMH